MDRITANQVIETLEIREAARRVREAPRGFGTGAYLTDAHCHERKLMVAVVAGLIVLGVAAVGMMDFGMVHPILAAVCAPLLH